jgi:hypothetical protein
VQDLAGLLVAEVVDLLALVASQKTQCARGDGRPQRQGLHRGDQTVTTEWHGEPGDTGGRHQVAVDVVNQEPQILHSAPQQLIEQLVIGLDLGRRRAPFVVRIAHADEGRIQHSAAITFECRAISGCG